MHEQDEREFWSRRALHFNELRWVKKRELIDALIDIVGFPREHVVLDAGTGTGSVAIALAPLVREVVAIDVSPDMLRLAQSDGHINVLFRLGDITKLE